MDEAEIEEFLNLLAKEIVRGYELLNKLADAMIAQQIRIELLNKDMLNFISDKDRRGNQIIQ